MRKVSNGGLKNASIVANELVKFLARNTNVEAIEALSTEVGGLAREQLKLKTQASEMSTKLNNVVALANTLNNTTQNHKNTLEKHNTRIQKCEGKL